MMKKTLYKSLCVFVLCLFISGCSGVDGMRNGFGLFSGGSGNNVNNVGKVDNTGQGLEVDFNIKSSDISSGRIIYQLSLLNSGKEAVKLTRNNFKLVFGRYDNRPVLVQDSIDSFYDKILMDKGEIVLYQNLDIKKEGVLKIDEAFLKSNVEKFNLDLEITYPSKTEFVSNLELKSEYDMYKIKSGSNFEQAAAIQVNSLNLIPSYNDEQYILEVGIFDKGESSTGIVSGNDVNNILVELRNFEIKFGEKKLDCKIKTLNGKESVRDINIRKNSNVILECPIKIENDGDFTTQVTGSFDYDYSVKKSLEVGMRE